MKYRVIHVAQGEFKVSGQQSELITTVLGSCVAACMWDPIARVGGVNHFVLTVGVSGKATNSGQGLHLMERLIAELEQTGAKRARLEAKLFGGARMFDGPGSVGEENARFARDFLEAQGIPCRGESLGGTSARKIRFWPTSGRAQQLVLTKDEDFLHWSRRRDGRPGPEETTFCLGRGPDCPKGGTLL